MPSEVYRQTPSASLPAQCGEVRAGFDGYLDGSIPGLEMQAISTHLECCVTCEEEFAALCAVQQSLAALGPAQPPVRLQAQLRQAIGAELAHGSHLSAAGRLGRAWSGWLGSATLRAGAAVAAAVLLAVGLGWMFAAPIASVQANDDAQASLVAPHFLYSQVAPLPIDSEAPVMVEAKIDTEGKVYDYIILAGPTGAAVRSHVEQNLLTSMFKPATLFGVPVRGRVVLTYTAVSARG
jgi:anti-sigma factor RsiW